MRVRRFFSFAAAGFAVAIVLLFAFGPVVMAQTTITPDVQVTDKGIVDGVATIASATSPGPGWIVIHAEADGKPGPVIGYAPLAEGKNTDIPVEVDETAVTPLLWAMLHEDKGAVGVYEFPGVDAPVKIGDNIVMAEFSAAPPLLPDTGGSTSPFLFLAVAGIALLALGGGVAISRGGLA